MRAYGWAVVSLLAMTACEAKLSWPLPSDPFAGAPTDPVPGQSGVRRLSRVELDTALNDLLGDTSNSAQGLLPPEPVNPFDNDYRAQFASAALIESVERFATDAANRVLANATQRAALITCSPNGPGDAACLRTVVQTVGRRVLRRPLTSEEVERFMALQTFAVEDANFDKIGRAHV